MDQEDKEILRKTLDVAQKNNRILEQMKRSMFWGRVMRYIYWAIILGVGVGAYYFIEPYIDQILSVYGGFKGNINSIFQ
ncbi:MAG: hypothetical protein AAB861_01260 [Patescibacteria group bacterium]